MGDFTSMLVLRSSESFYMVRKREQKNSVVL